MMELYQDTHTFDTGLVTIVEVMGRNAGWLTAASSIAGLKGFGPDLVYLPEVPFDIDKFVSDVSRIAQQKNNKVMVVLSEGIKDMDGKYISEYLVSLNKDSFGHAQLGGVATVLAGIVSDNLKIKVRPIEFSLLQRCAAHIASKTDIDEAYMAGVMAVRYAVQGETDKMVIFKRNEGTNYSINYELLDVHHAANAEKKIPRSWINEDGNGVNEKFMQYAMPLIQGDPEVTYEDGLPRYATLKKVRITKK
jgi:6-phosphofructokinase 1